MPIPWLIEEAVWVPQWPLSSEKLEAATKLISEQVRLGHLEPSTSPWNTPIFVIKKKISKVNLDARDSGGVSLTDESLKAFS